MYRTLGLIPAPQISDKNKTSFSFETTGMPNDNDIISWECALNEASEDGQCQSRFHHADANQDTLCLMVSHFSNSLILYMYFYYKSVKDFETAVELDTCDRSCKNMTLFYVSWRGSLI